MNFFTAKRLFPAAIGITVQRHEQMFGAIELDINRLRPPTSASTSRVATFPLKLDSKS